MSQQFQASDFDDVGNLQKSWNTLPQHGKYSEKLKEEIRETLEELPAQLLPHAAPPQCHKLYELQLCLTAHWVECEPSSGFQSVFKFHANFACGQP